MKYLKRFNESRTEAIEDCLLELTDLPYNFKYEVNKNGEIKLVGEIIGDEAFFYMEADWDGELHITKDTVKDPTVGLNFGQRKVTSRAIALQKELLSVLPFVLRKLNRDIIGPQTIEVCINSYSVARGTCIVVLFNY